MPRSAKISIGGCSEIVKAQSAKICLNFKFLGGGCSEVVKTQSAKICLNFNFQGAVFWSSQNSKCQDLPKFQFWGGRGCSEVVKTQKCQDLPKFQIWGDGVFWTKIQNRVFWGFWAQILPCHFLDSFASQIVSHILCMWRLINGLSSEARTGEYLNGYGEEAKWLLTSIWRILLVSNQWKQWFIVCNNRVQ